MLTQEQLKEVLNYNPETGDFTWKVRTSNRIQAGGIAGHLNVRGYITVRIGGKNYQAHRLAWLCMFGDFPKDEIDHINHVKNDNRIANLREATRQENNKNHSMNKRNTSGVVGVTRDRWDKKWQSNITVDGKLLYLGCFDDFFEAICSRLSANNKHGYHENHGK